MVGDQGGTNLRLRFVQRINGENKTIRERNFKMRRISIEDALKATLEGSNEKGEIP